MSRRRSNMSKRNFGFTLLELMLVVILLGIIAAIVLPRVIGSADDAKVKTCHHNRVEINSAIERYQVVNGSFPTDLSDLESAEYFPIGIPVCPVTGSTYTMNSTTNRVEGHASGTNPGDH